jgi:hypothetical protein
MKNKYTKEQREFLIKNNHLKTSQELADMFNKRFGTNITKVNIKNFRGNNHLNSGLTGQFKKGNIPHNKGKRQNDYMSIESIEKTKATRFKKGNIPANHRDVGSERITKDGYIEIKIKEPNKWQLKHRYIYEKKYGKIPKGYNLIFLDGNRKNIDLSNLKLVSKSEDLIMNKNKLFTTDKNITNTGSLIAKVIDKGNKLKNERL